MPRLNRLAAVERLVGKWQEETEREGPRLNRMGYPSSMSILGERNIAWGRYNTLCEVIRDLKEALGEVGNGD